MPFIFQIFWKFIHMVYVKGNFTYRINNTLVHVMLHFVIMFVVCAATKTLKENKEVMKQESQDNKIRAKFPKFCSLCICVTSL